MNTSKIKFLVGAALVGGAMTVAAGAQAYWGDPWGGPWSERGRGAGPWSRPAFPGRNFGPATLDRIHERQSQMRDHRAAMQSLGRMLSGNRNFDRAQAISLAREIEASAGENLVRLFKSGSGQGTPMSRARIGEDLGVFKSHALALQMAAGELAEQLEKQPSAEDVRTGRAWSPDWGRGGPYGPYRSRWRNDDEVLNREVFNAYNNLRSTCNGCHANFRSARR